MIDMKTYYNPDQQTLSRLLERSNMSAESLNSTIREIFDAVALNGDRALREYTLRFDKAALDSIEVSDYRIDQAATEVPDKLKEAIEVAVDNIAKFHRAQLPREVRVETMKGVVCVQRAVAIEKIGIYIPAGSAPLFSTVLMLAVPASIAGCRDIVMCTPADCNGRIDSAVLYAARRCGVKRIFKIGGAQAIAAMALGTESVPKVDKIFGPGNQYVAAAKRYAAARLTAVDTPAGPSEMMIIADSSANGAFVAADLLSQAEHGADSQVILVTDSRKLAADTLDALCEQLPRLPRHDIATRSLDSNGRIIVVDNFDQMIDIANRYAPEHLIVATCEPWSVAERIASAGSIFLGNYTPESAGDYASGTNHTLPTNGWAHSTGGVNIDSFVKKITIQHITADGLRAIGNTIETMAAAEKLDAHRNAVAIRLKATDDENN